MLKDDHWNFKHNVINKNQKSSNENSIKNDLKITVAIPAMCANFFVW